MEEAVGEEAAEWKRQMKSNMEEVIWEKMIWEEAANRKRLEGSDLREAVA